MDTVSEVAIERVSANGSTPSPELDVENGFRVYGPSFGESLIRFTKYSLENAEADTPWGKMALNLGLARGQAWEVLREGLPPASIAITPIGSIQLSIKEGSPLVFKSKSRFRTRMFRYSDGRGTVDIRTSWEGWFYNERRLKWKILFSGNPDVDKSSVVSTLAVFICYWKILTGYRKKGGRWRELFMYDDKF